MNADRKYELVKSILDNPVYQENSGLYIMLATELMKLSGHTLANLELVMRLKERNDGN